MKMPVDFLMQLNTSGVLNWGVGFLTNMAVFAILALALNLQWGYGGIFNVGVVAFFMVGAYTSAVLTLGAPGEFESYVGGWSLPVPVGWIGGMVAAAFLGLLIGLPALRLRRDFLAIVTIGLATILRNVASTVEGLVNRTSGLHAFPRLFGDFVDGSDYRWVAFGISLSILLASYIVVNGLLLSPWGRVLRGIRDNEETAQASGKSLFFFRTQAFIVGGMLMGLAGAVWAHNVRAISPSAFTDLFGTFLVWAMVMVGGSGNNRGVVIGAFFVGFLWFGVPLFQGFLPAGVESYIFQIRQFVLGLMIILVLIFRPQGIVPERAKVSRFIPKLKQG